MDFEGKQQSLLTFRIGPVLCCAPSLPVRSIITPPKLTHPPGSDSSQPGIFKHGSHIVKVIDLRQKFGVELSEQTQPGNLIITIFEKESFSFWVDQILDVFDFPTEGWGGLPAAIPRGVFSRTLLLNNKIHLYSEFEKLASINDLGYLKQYIQQIKENEVKESKIKGQNIKEQQTKKQDVKEKPAILEVKKEMLVAKNIKPEKVSEIKNNPISEIKKTRNIKNNNIAIASKASKPLKPTSAHNIQENKIKIPEAKTRIAPTVNPSVEKQQQIKPTTASAQDIKSSNDKTSINVNNKALNKEPHTPHSSINVEDESSSFGVIVLFILILSSLTAAGYFLFIDITSNNYKTTQKPSSVNTEVENTIKEPSFLQTDDFEETSPIQQQIYAETENKTIDDKDTETINNSFSIQKTETKNNTVIKNAEEKPYRADISQQDNDITITLHQPIESEELHQAEAVITAQPFDDSIITEKALGTPSVKKLKESELKNGIKPNKTVNVIIHIVVKGDTLWAIAKKHVHNPFLYPELARLSNIKNPHRIYPGNRVRIRFITK